MLIVWLDKKIKHVNTQQHTCLEMKPSPHMFSWKATMVVMYCENEHNLTLEITQLS